MATTKTATLTFRIDPGLKEALRTAAQNQHRSTANMMDVLIRYYFGCNGIAIPEQQSLFKADEKYPKKGAADMRKRAGDGQGV